MSEPKKCRCELHHVGWDKDVEVLRCDKCRATYMAVPLKKFMKELEGK